MGLGLSLVVCCSFYAFCECTNTDTMLYSLGTSILAWHNRVFFLGQFTVFWLFLFIKPQLFLFDHSSRGDLIFDISKTQGYFGWAFWCWKAPLAEVRLDMWLKLGEMMWHRKIPAERDKEIKAQGSVRATVGKPFIEVCAFFFPEREKRLHCNLKSDII